MGIARALRRVKRQAKRGGLDALRSGLGEELRSGAIPGPLRGAARRIAALIDPHAPHASRHQPGSTATPRVDRTPPETLRQKPPEHANKVGNDRGDEPKVEPAAPADHDKVDPISVGATPVYDATPTVVKPIDATPRDVAPRDVTQVVVSEPVVVEPVVVVEPAVVEPAVAESSEPASEETVEAPAKPTLAAKPVAKPAKAKKKDDHGAAPSKPAPSANASSAQAKEKLAPAKEEAKSAARSGTKAKRSGGQGGKTSKKK